MEKMRLTRREQLAARDAPPQARAVGEVRSRLLARAAPVVLALLVAVSYFPALWGGFVWDDVIFAEEPVIHAPSGLWRIWFSPADIENEGHYWPLVYTSFWLEHKLWGLAPVGYHAVNILLHLVNVLLLWCLMVRLAVPGAGVIAAVFAVHPLHVESVAWVIERKDVLSALFYLTAVLVWMRYVEAPRLGRYALALVLFTAGLLSKSVVVTLPVALLIWRWWTLGRVPRTDLLRLWPFFVVAAGITAADLSFYTSREPLALGYTAVERVLIAARALWFYVGKLLWPTELAVIYPLWEIDAADPVAWAYLAAALALAAVLWFGRHWMGRGPLAGALFFAVTLGPVLGFVDYGYMQFSLVADRFQYLAGIGVLAVLIGAAAHGVGRLPDAFRRGAWVLTTIVVVMLGALTWRQAGIYRDPLTFFSHVVALNPAARDAHLNLCNALLKAGRAEEGLAAARVAVEQRPDDAGARANLGRALSELERFAEAGESLDRALELDPRHKGALQNTAELLRKQALYEAAIEAYHAVLERDRAYPLAYAGMGDALFRLGRYEEALAPLAQALALQPGLPMAGTMETLMGRAARELGRFGEAARHFERAMALDPGDPTPVLDLATLRALQQRHDEADELLGRVRAMRPHDPATLQEVAEALRKQGRFEESLAAFRAVLEIDVAYALAHAGMGDALFRLGRFEESLASLAQALTLQPGQPASAALHRLMGRAAHELERPEAAGHFERALQIDPRDAETLDYLAMLRFGEQRYEAALRLYETLVEINPGSAQTHTNLGATLYHLGRPQEAMRSFERAVVLDPDLETARTGLEEARKLLVQRRQ